jgi:hypothetical protein
MNKFRVRSAITIVSTSLLLVAWGQETSLEESLLNQVKQAYNITTSPNSSSHNNLIPLRSQVLPLERGQQQSDPGAGFKSAMLQRGHDLNLHNVEALYQLAPFMNNSCGSVYQPFKG